MRNYVLKKIVYVLNKIHFFRERACARANIHLLNLAKKSIKLGFNFHTLKEGWATQDCLTEINYAKITIDLFRIDDLTGNRINGNCNIPLSLHWSRRFEYPWAILNAKFPVNPESTLKILDCGAGLSPLQFYLARKGYSVYTIDLDSSSLRKVEKIKSKMSLSTLHPYYGNILDMPFPHGVFHRILCISVLEHVVHQMNYADAAVVLKSCINEMLRVLKPEGLLLLTFDVNLDPKKSNHRLYYKDLENLCQIVAATIPKQPKNLLFSSDTAEGRFTGIDLAIFYLILKKRKIGA